MTTEIFRTNVTEKQEAGYLKKLLQLVCPDGMIRFHLAEDNQLLEINIGREVSELVSQLLKDNGFHCEKLYRDPVEPEEHC